jgi:hypothetical protein
MFHSTQREASHRKAFAKVFGMYADSEARRYDQIELAEKIILSLRRKLREADPSLPIEYDGAAWASIENIQDSAAAPGDRLDRAPSGSALQGKPGRRGRGATKGEQ